MGDTNQIQKLAENIQWHAVDPLEVLGSGANPGNFDLAHLAGRLSGW